MRYSWRASGAVAARAALQQLRVPVAEAGEVAE